MDEIKPNIGGSRDPSLYSAICRDALLDQRVVIVVAEEKSEIIGFLLAVIDRDRWRMSFMFRHPRITAKMVWDRAVGRLRKRFHEAEPEPRTSEGNGHDISRYINPAETNKSWKDSSPQIAKLLFICVKERDRRKRFAKGLFDSMLAALAERGVKRADAIVLLTNIPSLRMSHEQLGFDMFIQDGHIFQTKDIG
jgi:ribosomal protein S18 acetylase RimI-like enzyme